MNKTILSKNLKKPGYFFRKKNPTLFKQNISVYKEHEKIISIKNIGKAFEIGYGPGDGIENYCSNYQINIEGIDFSRVMFSEARKRNLKHIKDHKVKLHFGDFDKFIPLENNYDLVYLFNVIYFMKDPESSISKIFHMLKETGKISIFMDSAETLMNNPNLDNSIFHPYENTYIISLLKKTGFHDIQEIESSSFKGSFFIIGSK